MLEEILKLKHRHYEPQQYCDIFRTFEKENKSLKRVLDSYVHYITEQPEAFDCYASTVLDLYHSNEINRDVKNSYINIALSVHDLYLKKPQYKQLEFDFGDEI